jgi:6-phosphogluconolactonase
MYQITQFPSRVALEQSLVQQVAELLAVAIKQNGSATLAVSGGSTPIQFFQLLSQQELAWSKVTITLADERWVEQNHDASNTASVKQHLCQNLAASAKFFELKVAEPLSDELLIKLSSAAQQLLPFDVLILGMGEDGHTASLFPCSEQLEYALTTTQALVKVQPKSAPHQRISFSLSALLKSRAIFLHLAGQNKQQVLNQAIAGNDSHAMPIRALLHDAQQLTQVLWAE